MLTSIKTSYCDNNPFNVILKNKDKLITNFFKHQSELPCSTSWCLIPQRDSLVTLLNSTDLKLADKKYVVKYFLNFSRCVILANSNHLWIEESCLFDFFIECLQSDNNEFVNPSYNILVGYTTIPALRKNRNKIKIALNNSPTISLNRKVKLLALATSQTEILNDTSTLERKVKEYLSDTLTESKLIADLDSSKIYRNKLKAVEKLVLKGNNRCLKALIIHFNKPSFAWTKINEYSEPCTTQTLRVPIIQGISRYYPNNPLLNDSLFFLMNCNEKKQNVEYISKYFKMFLEWAKKEFGVVPKDSELTPTINQSCREY